MSVGGAGGAGRSGGANASSRTGSDTSKADKSTKAAEATAKAAEAAAKAAKQKQIAEDARKAKVLGNFRDVFDAVGSLTGLKSEAPTQVMGAALDFAKNFHDMTAANWKGVDGYYHCKANFEATRRGKAGHLAAMTASVGREVSDAYRGKSDWDSFRSDMRANLTGQVRALSGSYASSKEACADLRPKGFSDKSN